MALCGFRRVALQMSKSVQKRTLFTELTAEEITQPKIQCRNRPYLAGANSPNLPEYVSDEISRYFKGIKLSSKWKNRGDMKEIGRELRLYIDKHMKDNYSAFLIKGLPFTELTDFQHLIAGIDYKPFVYDAGTASRSDVADFLYTASDEPCEVTIEPHNEMAYLETYPSKIMFYCINEAACGGDSPLVFNRDIMRDLDAKIVQEVKDKGIRYIRNLSHHKNCEYLTWQETFKTQSEEKAEDIMRREKMKWDWQANGDLSIWNVVDATIQHPQTGEEIWFNQITSAHCSYYKAMPRNESKQHLRPNQFHLHTCYGDGEEIEEHFLDEIRAVTWNNAMALKLQPGDILLLDNLLCLHTRMSFKGNDRKILVNLSW